jgi:GPH family glycoside/pentoside/hexuronide:cation symporter
VLSYSSPTVGLGFMFFLVGLYMMPFATDVLAMSPAAISTIFLVSRVWDAISDPVAGFMSDRTGTRFGRRRPWLAASAPLILIVYTMMWMPPSTLEGGWLVAWMAAGVFGFYTAMTVFIVPHQALGAELTDDYHDRTRIFATRHVTWSVGSVIAVAGMQFLINAKESGGAEYARTLAGGMGFGVALLGGALILFAATVLRERAEFQGRGGDSPLRAFRDVWRNPHARLLLIVFLIENLGAATIGVLTFYVASYVVMRPELTGVFILCYMFASIGFTPIWLPLSRRFGKKNLWLFSMLLTGVAFGGMWFLQENSWLLISVLATLGGTAAGCGAMVGPSIQADVIDYDEYTTGERKEGAYFAAWNFVFKSATGITIGLTGWVLDVAGYVPNQPQTEQVRNAILFLYAIFPLTCYLIGAYLFSRFSLGPEEHVRIRTALDARRAGGG